MVRSVSAQACALLAAATLGGMAPVEQKFLCEQSYTNFAWGYQHSGTYVDHAGRVYRYAAARQVRPKQDRAVTEAELEEKYSQGRTLLRTVPPGEIGKMQGLIEPASKGSYSAKKPAANDFGAIVSSCYLYDPAAKTYRRIELEVGGDWTYSNTSAAAKQLTEWLTAILKP